MISDVAAEPREAQTFAQFVRAAAAAYGDRPAVVLKRDGMVDEVMTFAGLERASAQLARALVARGGGKGSRIGFIYGNGPSFAVIYAAIARIGAVAIPLSTFIKSDELVRVLRQSDVSGLLIQRTLLGTDYVERLCDALPELASSESSELRIGSVPFLRWIVSSGHGLPRALVSDDSLLAQAESVSEGLLALIEREVHPADQIMEIYTSGSMAQPKGVKHNHGPLLRRVYYLARMMKVPAGLELEAFLPLFWVGGLGISLLINLTVGSTTVCREKTVSDSRTAMGVVLSPDDLDRMRGVPVYWALGMSETFGPYAYGDEIRAEGYPLCSPLDNIAEGFEVRVVDEQGAPVVDGGIGEIQVRGEGLTPGLHKMDRSIYFTPDGFYRTGDLGKVEGRRINFVGRDGDMIKTAGANVSPAEVEAEMQQIGGIESAYVVGVPDEERGQLVVAAMVPRDGVELDYTAIEAALRHRLSSYKVPRVYLTINREEVPMLPTNKVSRRQMEALVICKLPKSA